MHPDIVKGVMEEPEVKNGRKLLGESKVYGKKYIISNSERNL